MLWTTAKLAEATGLTQRHIGRLIKNGTIKGQKVGHDWIVMDEDAQKFIKERQSEADAEEDDIENVQSIGATHLQATVT